MQNTRFLWIDNLKISEYHLSTLLHIWGRWNGLHLAWWNFNSSSRVWTGQLSAFAKALSQPETLVHHLKCNNYNSFSLKRKSFFTFQIVLLSLLIWRATIQSGWICVVALELLISSSLWLSTGIWNEYSHNLLKLKI